MSDFLLKLKHDLDNGVESKEFNDCTVPIIESIDNENERYRRNLVTHPTITLEERLSEIERNDYNELLDELIGDEFKLLNGITIIEHNKKLKQNLIEQKIQFQKDLSITQKYSLKKESLEGNIKWIDDIIKLNDKYKSEINKNLEVLAFIDKENIGILSEIEDLKKKLPYDYDENIP